MRCGAVLPVELFILFESYRMLRLLAVLLLTAAADCYLLAAA
jgi:hypothetical protein